MLHSIPLALLLHKWACSSSRRAPPGSKREDTLGASGTCPQVPSGVEMVLEIWVGYKQQRVSVKVIPLGISESPGHVATTPYQHLSLLLLLITLQCIFRFSNYGFSQEIKKLYIVKFASFPVQGCLATLYWFCHFLLLVIFYKCQILPFVTKQCPFFPHRTMLKSSWLPSWYSYWEVEGIFTEAEDMATIKVENRWKQSHTRKPNRDEEGGWVTKTREGSEQLLLR